MSPSLGREVCRDQLSHQGFRWWSVLHSRRLASAGHAFFADVYLQTLFIVRGVAADALRARGGASGGWAEGRSRVDLLRFAAPSYHYRPFAQDPKSFGSMAPALALRLWRSSCRAFLWHHEPGFRSSMVRQNPAGLRQKAHPPPITKEAELIHPFV